MNLLERPRRYHGHAHSIREEIILTPGETVKARFALWFKANQPSSPRHCGIHPSTPLVLDRARTGAFQATTPGYWYSDPPIELPGQFNLHAVWKCPACQCAYALCPPELQATSFETFNTSTPERQRALALARAFVVQINQHGCGFALFVGMPGNGKTRLACNIIRELANGDALYVRQARLREALRATYNRSLVEFDEDGRPIEPEHPLPIVQEVRFLVLDEIGCDPLASDEGSLLGELIKHRYDHRLPTIYISNLPFTGQPDAPGLKEYLGDALTDRIREATGNNKFIMQFAGESYRHTTGEAYLSVTGQTSR